MYLENLHATVGLCFVIPKSEDRTCLFKHGIGDQCIEAGFTSTSIPTTGTGKLKDWSNSERPDIHGDIVPMMILSCWKILMRICSALFSRPINLSPNLLETLDGSGIIGSLDSRRKQESPCNLELPMGSGCERIPGGLRDRSRWRMGVFTHRFIPLLTD
jgi:hypothetical protein